MTNKEAIEILKPLTEYSDKNGIGTFPMVSTLLQVEALDIAIKALERDGTMSYENGEPTVCVCPVCGSVWKIKE
jgi:hypothetical protein